MSANNLMSKYAILTTQEMIKDGYMKHEIEEHLLHAGVSSGEVHEIVENLYAQSKGHKIGKKRKTFWQYAIGLVSAFV